MATAQQGTGRTPPGAGPVRPRRVRWLVAGLAVIMPVVVTVTVLFGGPVIGRLTMHDLNGHRYTVTAIRVDGRALPLPADASTISFRDGSATWTAGCNEASARYEITWSTLATTGSVVTTAMGCGDVSRSAAALGGVVASTPEIHLDDQRLSMSSSTTWLELIESS